MIRERSIGQIIPSINVKTPEALRERLKLIESFGVPWAQIDVSDGIFTDHLSFNDPVLLRDVKTPLFLEAHLMIFEPEHTIREWIYSGVKRIVFHHEATHKKEEITGEVQRAGLEVGIALCPITPWQFIEGFLPKINLVQILGVPPGPTGQKFQGEEIIRKIRELRSAHPDVIIEVDGGVNETNAKILADAGANILAVGSYLFESNDPKKTLEELQRIVTTKHN